jgi:hypothetical protein
MPPAAEDALTLLQKTGVNLVINTLALKLPERQQLFAKLLSPISDLRGRTGRPHWLVIDEAHQLLAATNKSASRSLLENVLATIYITVNLEFLANSETDRLLVDATRKRAQCQILVHRLSIIKGILTVMSATRAGGARRLGVKIGHYNKPIDLTA